MKITISEKMEIKLAIEQGTNEIRRRINQASIQNTHQLKRQTRKAMRSSEEKLNEIERRLSACRLVGELAANEKII